MLKQLPIIAAFLILLAFTPPFLRANTFDPSHPRAVAGNCTQDIKNCKDKAWWLILFGLPILGLGFLKKLKKAETLLLKLMPTQTSKAFYFPQLFNPLSIAFRRGIIHPQIYA